MKLIQILKSWLRKFCGGNSHVVLGHARAYPSGIAGFFDPTNMDYQNLQIPVVLAGSRYMLVGKLKDLRPLMHPITGSCHRATRLQSLVAHLLFPALPLLTFGRLFEDMRASMGIYPRPSLIARAKLFIAHSRARATGLLYRIWEFIKGPTPLIVPDPMNVSPFLRFLNGGTYPSNMGETTRTTTGGGESQESRINPDWVKAGPESDLHFVTHDRAFDVLDVPKPKAKVCACKRTRPSKSPRKSPSKSRVGLKVARSTRGRK